jgi:hypothetical protein
MGFLCKTFGHKWERLLNECSRRCRVCGATETIEHQWQQIEGQCAEKCKVCGKRRGQRSPHRWIRQTAESFAEIFQIQIYYNRDIKRLIASASKSAHNEPLLCIIPQAFAKFNILWRTDSVN